jgi:hypothetical protein
MAQALLQRAARASSLCLCEMVGQANAPNHAASPIIPPKRNLRQFCRSLRAFGAQ